VESRHCILWRRTFTNAFERNYNVMRNSAGIEYGAASYYGIGTVKMKKSIPQVS